MRSLMNYVLNLWVYIYVVCVQRVGSFTHIAAARVTTTTAAVSLVALEEVEVEEEGVQRHRPRRLLLGANSIKEGGDDPGRRRGERLPHH